MRALVPGAGAGAGARAPLERAALEAPSFDDPRYVHLVLEVLKGAFADREYRYGDPAFVDVGLEELLSDRARRRAPRRDRPGPRDAGHAGADRRARPTSPCTCRRRSARSTRARATRRTSASSTPTACAFSATPSDGSYCCPVVPGSASSRPSAASSRAPTRGIPSGVGPGRRPRLTPNPAMAVRDDGSLLVIGCPGGDMQVQAMLQVVLNAFVFGMDVQAAIDAPRYSTWSFPNSFAPHEYLPGRVCVEDRFGDALPDALQRAGPRGRALARLHARGGGGRGDLRRRADRLPARGRRPAAARLRHRGMSVGGSLRRGGIHPDLLVPRLSPLKVRRSRRVLRRDGCRLAPRRRRPPERTSSGASLVSPAVLEELARPARPLSRRALTAPTRSLRSLKSYPSSVHDRSAPQRAAALRSRPAGARRSAATIIGRQTRVRGASLPVDKPSAPSSLRAGPVSHSNELAPMSATADGVPEGVLGDLDVRRSLPLDVFG